MNTPLFFKQIQMNTRHPYSTKKVLLLMAGHRTLSRHTLYLHLAVCSAPLASSSSTIGILVASSLIVDAQCRGVLLCLSLHLQIQCLPLLYTFCQMSNVLLHSAGEFFYVYPCTYRYSVFQYNISFVNCQMYCCIVQESSSLSILVPTDTVSSIIIYLLSIVKCYTEFWKISFYLARGTQSSGRSALTQPEVHRVLEDQPLPSQRCTEFWKISLYLARGTQSSERVAFTQPEVHRVLEDQPLPSQRYKEFRKISLYLARDTQSSGRSAFTQPEVQRVQEDQPLPSQRCIEFWKISLYLARGAQSSGRLAFTQPEVHRVLEHQPLPSQRYTEF